MFVHASHADTHRRHRCPSVCLYCVEMAASRITPYSPHDSPIILIFCEVNTVGRFAGGYCNERVKWDRCDCDYCPDSVHSDFGTIQIIYLLIYYWKISSDVTIIEIHIKIVIFGESDRNRDRNAISQARSRFLEHFPSVSVFGDGNCDRERHR